MENIYGLLNTFGVVPAEWYTDLNETQKLVFVTLAGVTLGLATLSLTLLASRWRGKKMPEHSCEERELKKKLADVSHDLLFDALNTNQITPKFYKRMCRDLGVILPDLHGSPYTEKTQMFMAAMRKRLGIINRIEELRKRPVSSYITFWQRTQRKSKFLP